MHVFLLHRYVCAAVSHSKLLLCITLLQYGCSALYSVQIPAFRVWFSSATIIMLGCVLLLSTVISVQLLTVFRCASLPCFQRSRRYFYPDMQISYTLGLDAYWLTATYQLWARLTASLLVGSVYVRILSSLSVSGTGFVASLTAGLNIVPITENSPWCLVTARKGTLQLLW